VQHDDVSAASVSRVYTAVRVEGVHHVGGIDATVKRLEFVLTASVAAPLVLEHRHASV